MLSRSRPHFSRVATLREAIGREKCLRVVCELQGTCGCIASETKQDLFEQAKVHLQACDRRSDPLDKNVLRALIVQRARPVAADYAC